MRVPGTRFPCGYASHVGSLAGRMQNPNGAYPSIKAARHTGDLRAPVCLAVFDYVLRGLGVLDGLVQKGARGRVAVWSRRACAPGGVHLLMRECHPFVFSDCKHCSRAMEASTKQRVCRTANRHTRRKTGRSKRQHDATPSSISDRYANRGLSRLASGTGNGKPSTTA